MFRFIEVEILDASKDSFILVFSVPKRIIWKESVVFAFDKGRFCNTIAIVGLIGMSIQSD